MDLVPLDIENKNYTAQNGVALLVLPVRKRRLYAVITLVDQGIAYAHLDKFDVNAPSGVTALKLIYFAAGTAYLFQNYTINGDNPWNGAVYLYPTFDGAVAVTEVFERP